MKLLKASKSILKRTLACALSLCLGVGVFASPVEADVGDGNSNDRISTYINLAAGKSLMDDDLSGVSLSKDQMRFLGVYVSNFFVPFGTELGEAAGDDTETVMDQVKDALQSGLNFSDGYAETFSETIMGLSRSSATDLVFAASINYHEDYILEDKYAPRSNYYNFLTTMLGSGRKIIDNISTAISDDGDSPLYSTGDNLQYGYWGYMKGTEFVPVADFYMDIEDGLTPSQVAFLACLNSVDPEMGFGWNVWDLNSSEVSSGDELASMTPELYLQMSIFGEKMMVDCFGNIIVYGHQHQVVAVPGCINPYTWVSVDADGNDKLDAGGAYNMVNFPSMALADQGIGEDNPVYSDTGTATAGTSIGSVRHSTSLTSDSTIGEAIADNSSASRNIASNLQSILAYCDGISGNGTDWSVTVESGSVIIAASLDAMSTLDSSKLDESWSGWQDRAKYDAFQEAIGELEDKGISRNDLKNVLSALKTEAEGEISSLESMSGNGNEQDTDANTGRSNVLLKSLYPLYPFSWQNNNSSEPLAEENLRFIAGALKLYRGTNESNLDQEIGFWSASEWKEGLKKALQSYHTTYPYDMSISLSHWTLDNGFESADSITIPVTLATDSTVASPVNFLDCLIVIDDLGAYHFDTSSSAVQDYKTFNALNYINEDNSTINTSTNGLGWSYGSGNNFSAGYSDIESGSVAAPLNISDAAKVSLYVSYCFSCLYNNTATDKANTIGMIGYRMNTSGLPDITDDPLALSEDSKSDIMLTSIRNWLYYLLHPIEGVNYVRELLTNKINGFLLGWHNDMLGTNGVGQTTGTTLYRSNTGYVTTPDLSEIEWTDALINFYNQCIPFLLVVMIVTMVFAYITGILSLQRSIFGVVIFAIFLLLPVNLINGVVGFSNRISENLYGEKFTYWALVQQESYASAIDEAADQDTNGDSSYSNYLQELYAQNNAVYSNQGSESIVLKWQAPKKMTSIMIGNDESYQSLSEDGQFLLNAFLSNMYSGESFVDDEDSVYLYRSYLDISNYSRYIWRGIDSGVQRANTSLTNDITSNVSGRLRNSINNMATDFAVYRQDGYTNAGSAGTDPKSNLHVVTPLSSKIVNDALADIGMLDNMGIDDFTGINQNLFNFGIPVFNSGDSISDALFDNMDNSGASDAETDSLTRELAGYTNEDLVGLAAYSLMSESVFYYFSWNLYDLGLQPTSSTSGGYKDLLLGAENAGFFYNTVSNGELKDFMDMKSLFTYIIPYLKQCNDLVNEWDDIYGLFTYDGVPTEEGHWDDPDIQGNVEMEQRYWHNLNVARLYGIYTPWVDIMYDCSYADGEYINAMGEKFYVSDPLDPTSYPDERPMIFSESEMHEYGLGEGDLTKVERLILDCNRGMEERLYELLNYYNFSDVTLNTAAAINCAFEFNNTFSENGIFSENHNIYPQSFELADFSYDAFLRFILSNTTGETMNTTEDFYANIVDNSSMTTVLIMLILDILSMYVLPAFKIFFLIAVFLSALLIIVTTAFRVDPEQRFIKRLFAGVVLPMIKFMVITIGFAYVISLFMGTGNNAVTQTKEISIQMGDPVVVMLAMCAVNIIVLILYFKVIKKVVQDMKQNSKMAVNFMGGVFGGAAAMAVGAVGGAALAGSHSRGFRGRHGEGDSGSEAQEGTGAENERARIRGSQDVNSASDVDEAKQSTRRNDSKRDAIRMNQNTPKSREQEKEKKESLNEKTKRGMDLFNKESTAEGKRTGNIPKFNKTIKDPGSKRSNKSK